MTRPNVNQVRKERYKLLRDNGFTRTEATRFKSFNDLTISQLIELKKEYQSQYDKAVVLVVGNKVIKK